MAPPRKDKSESRRGRPAKYPMASDAPAEGGRSGVPVNFRIDPQLAELMPKFQAKFLREHNVRLDKTAVLEKALRELYQRAGLIPPDDGKTPDAE